jgi:hypothetical protein
MLLIILLQELQEAELLHLDFMNASLREQQNTGQENA